MEYIVKHMGRNMASRSFVNEYFENKSGEKLKRTIATDWKLTEGHLKLLELPSDIGSVAEIGCGIGRLLKELRKDIPICVGFDASSDMIREGLEYCAGTDIRLIKVDGSGTLPITEMFDLVFSFAVFQHIPDHATVFRYLGEMYRIMKPGGHMVFQVLKKDEYPGRELWTYHDPEVLTHHLEWLGLKNIVIREFPRWLVFHVKGNV